MKAPASFLIEKQQALVEEGDVAPPAACGLGDAKIHQYRNDLHTLQVVILLCAAVSIYPLLSHCSSKEFKVRYIYSSSVPILSSQQPWQGSETEYLGLAQGYRVSIVAKLGTEAGKVKSDKSRFFDAREHARIHTPVCQKCTTQLQWQKTGNKLQQSIYGQSLYTKSDHCSA